MSFFKNSCGSIDTPTFFNGVLTEICFSLFEKFNTKNFPKELTIPTNFVDIVNYTYSTLKYELPKINTYDLEKIDVVQNDKNVVVAFSGGLDSVYITLKLLNEGYIPHLIYVNGMNRCEGNKSFECASEFSKKFNLDLEIVNFKRKGKSDWLENPFRNELIKSICVDYALENNYSIIASGEDSKMSVSNISDILCVCDTIECQKLYAIAINNYTDNKFVFKNTEYASKIEKLKYLDKYDTLDYYYSCTCMYCNFEQLKNQTKKKFNIEHFVPKQNCLCCRKCTQHMLFLENIEKVKLSDSYRDYCWNKVKTSKLNNKYDWSLSRENLINIIGD